MINIFLGSFYLINLILAIVAMSYDELQRQAEEEAQRWDFSLNFELVLQPFQNCREITGKILFAEIQTLSTTTTYVFWTFLGKTREKLTKTCNSEKIHKYF